jgi:hypothetical protein
MPTAVACSQAGDANQSLNRLRLHCINEDASGLRKQARPAEDQFRVWRYSKRLNDRVSTRERRFNRALIKRITFQLLKFGIVQTYRVRRPRQRAHRIALFEGEFHRLMADPPASAHD